MRPVWKGLTTSAIACGIWISTSVYGGIIEGCGGSLEWWVMPAIYASGIATFTGLPLGIVVEIVKAIRRR